MTPVTVAHAPPAAAAVLAGIQAAAFDPDTGPHDPWSPDAWSTLLHQPGVVARVAAAPDADTPAGVLLTRTIAGQAELLTIATVPAFRRRGVARALLADFVRDCRHAGVTEVALEVAADNAAAAALYAAVGFRTAGRRRRYYRRRRGAAVDATVMILRLDNRTAPAPFR